MQNPRLCIHSTNQWKKKTHFYFSCLKMDEANDIETRPVWNRLGRSITGCQYIKSQILRPESVSRLEIWETDSYASECVCRRYNAYCRKYIRDGDANRLQCAAGDLANTHNQLYWPNCCVLCGFVNKRTFPSCVCASLRRFSACRSSEFPNLSPLCDFTRHQDHI